MIIQNYLEIPNKTFHKLFSVSNSSCCCLSINFAYTLYAIFCCFLAISYFVILLNYQIYQIEFPNLTQTPTFYYI